jgi:hypothetical protein
MFSSQQQRGVTRWADGAAWVRTRQLAPEEIAEVRRRGAGLLAAGAIAAAGTAGALGLFLATLLTAAAETSLPLWLQGFILLNLLLVSLLLLAATRLLPRGWRLLRDASAGEADCFEDRRGDTVVHQVERLPRSGLAWMVNGQRAPRSTAARPLPVNEVADIPAFAALAAEWVEPRRTRQGETVHVGQRELSVAEQGELRRLRALLVSRAFGVAGALTGWAIVAWSIRIATGGYAVGHNGVVLLLLAVAAGVADLHAWRVLRLTRRLSADLQTGRVGILREPRADPTSRDEPTELGEALEVLPASGLSWTRAGRPAGWRLPPPP